MFAELLSDTDFVASKWSSSGEEYVPIDLDTDGNRHWSRSSGY